MAGNTISNRRSFLKKSGAAIAGVLVLPNVLQAGLLPDSFFRQIKVNAHLWVYASKFPPNWDCTPILDTVFSDLSYAGIDGLELMEANLRHYDSVEKLKSLIEKYNLPVSGSSYGVGFRMWDKDQHERILEDVNIVVPRLGQVNGKTFGISVGSADHLKTEKELDAQADILQKIILICDANGIQANMHNHTYEVENELHDLKGMIERIPDLKLGPDINWLIRAGVDPITFIKEYGKQTVYLHIRDQYADGTWTEYVGQGVTDYHAVAKALKAQKFKGQAAIELAFPNDFTHTNPLKEDWKLSRKYVHDTFGW